MRRLFLMLGLVALVAGAAQAGTLVTNDGSFGPSLPLGTPFSVAVTTTLTQFIAAPTPVPNTSPSYTPAIHFYALAGFASDSATGGPMLLEHGTGTNCATNTTIDGVLSNAANVVASPSYGLAWGNGAGVVYQLPAGTAACVVGTATIVTAFTWGTYAIY